MTAQAAPMRALILAIAVLSGSALLAWQPVTPQADPNTADHTQADQPQPENASVGTVDEELSVKEQQPDEEAPRLNVAVV